MNGFFFSEVGFYTIFLNIVLEVKTFRWSQVIKVWFGLAREYFLLDLFHPTTLFYRLTIMEIISLSQN